ncbi:hypothetical protein [Desulfosporosinus sp. OT]|uniref:hypothetical protein n=1 Tax=Desulfosporosinus sp. OT TaxID=913865 RepID=UPI000223A4EB|nr:hypothetical protein [Desulfosporosinus sp. OT]EGW36492.1 hypothetical protein DOT_5656 [Desulfosporosinus sp. OT]
MSKDSLYEKQFQKVHQLLKDHGCKPTFSFYKDYKSPVILGGSSFYQTDKEKDLNHGPKEWREEVDANLDVCVPTKKAYSEREKIRFDIEWSQKACLYSMYVSLPTSARSISLSRNRYKTQEELMADVENWLVKVGCKRASKTKFKNPESKDYVSGYKQIELFA